MMQTITRQVAIGLATIVAAITVSAPGVANAQADEIGPRLERACLRIPNIETRTANLIERLEADATVRGSLAWLQTRIDKATAAGRTQLAEVLANRFEVRTKTLEILHQRQTKLPELRQLCIDHGVTP